jgi:pimeloyl-ACP methyl ester carboxylesterase
VQWPIIYVHGVLGHLRFAELADGLPASPVLKPDLLGYGRYRAVPARELDLTAQAEHLHTLIGASFGLAPVVLVAHSAGAAIAVRYAQRYPRAVGALVSTEGNLAASDTFLSARLAVMTPSQVARWLEGVRTAPGPWLAQQRLQATPMHLQRLLDWLDNQPAEVVHAMCRALVSETAVPRYAAAVRETFARHPVHLIMGHCRSRPPSWLRSCATRQPASPAWLASGICCRWPIRPALWPPPRSPWPGFPPELLPWLSEPMARGTELGTAQRSVGLGLFIVKDIVRAHGGTIEVPSDQVGGTSFQTTHPRR